MISHDKFQWRGPKQKIDIESVHPAPWRRHGWTGSLISFDGCDTSDFTEKDVSEVLQFVSTEGHWDGSTAGIAKLKDGRFIGWEATYGPTGNGFSRDAYGGTADIYFGKTEAAVLEAIGESARTLLRGAA